MTLFSTSRTKILIFLTIVALVHADDMGMDMGDEKVEFHPINARSKSFHWILSVALLLILPSISTAFAFANRLHWSLALQFVSTAYSVFESLFLPFPDNTDNHENRTSKGTSWFLSILLGVIVFMGSFINGSNLVINRFYPNVKSSGEYGISYKVYKTLLLASVFTGWVRVSIAPIALFGFCYGRHTGQCIAHGIMGLAFVAYSFVLCLVLIIPWIRKHQLINNTGMSQEFYDSTLMCAWGIVNTFTEHRWGKEDWGMGDYQHTAMGIIWWSGGLLGMWLARNNNRTFVPALLLIFTGYSMSQHAQHLVISTKVHAVFGLALMGAGLSRIFEISLILRDKACAESGKIASFQFIPPFCLTLSGILFLGATEEQLNLVHDLGSDHLAYILVLSSGAFLVFLWIVLVLALYLRLVGYNEDGELGLDHQLYRDISAAEAQEFELDDLSEDETPSNERESD